MPQLGRASIVPIFHWPFLGRNTCVRNQLFSFPGESLATAPPRISADDKNRSGSRFPSRRSRASPPRLHLLHPRVHALWNLEINPSGAQAPLGLRRRDPNLLPGPGPLPLAGEPRSHPAQENCFGLAHERIDPLGRKSAKRFVRAFCSSPPRGEAQRSLPQPRPKLPAKG